MNNNVVQSKELDKYKEHKVVINGKKYIKKLDKKTNKEMYKRQFSVSLPNVKNPPRLTTSWQSSVTKVNKEIERIRSEVRVCKSIPRKTSKHLYEDVVNDIFNEGVKICIEQSNSFDTIEKFKSNNYKYVLNNKMAYKNFKHRNIEDLTIADIKTLKKNINSYAIQNGLSKITVGSIFGNIDRTLKWASEKMYIDDTIANSVHIAPQGKKSSNVFSIKNFLLEDEFKYLMDNFDSIKFTKKETEFEHEYRQLLYKTFIDCAFKLGFRRGEGFALYWGDYTEDKIHIHSTLNTKFVKKHMKNITERRIKPKNDPSDCVMKTPNSIKQSLNKWKKYCNSLGIDTSDDQPIFRELNGSTFKPTTFAERLKAIMEQSGVANKFDKQIYPHAFRHSACSFLIQRLREKDSKISLREIKIQVGAYLGHTDDEMVQQVYGHLYPTKEDSVINQLLDEI